jgi:hypothetical protein
MIRVWLTPHDRAYGYDVTGWEYEYSSYYDNLLTEDLLERVDQGDIVIYFDCNESAVDWCNEKGYEYELVK